jgi:N-acetylneuraminic acid mutarotase
VPRALFVLLCSSALCAACASSAGDGNRPADPPAPTSKGTWSTGTPLPIERFEGYGAVAGGHLYFVGGITGVFGDMRTAQPSRRVDAFDPKTNAWETAPELPVDAPKHHLTVAISQDRIYVLGGFDGILGQRPNEPFRPIATAYVFDGNEWRKLASPPLARGGATAQAIDGKIYVTGGAPNEGEPSYDELDIYDIATDRWTTGPKLPTAREHLASCAIDGKMIVVGGWVGAARTATRAAEEYDPKAARWTVLPSMPTARGGLGAVARGTQCHVVGGEDWFLPFPGTFAVQEVFDTTLRTWITLAPMPTARHGLGVGLLGDALYAIGGGPSQGNSYTGAVEIFRP